MSISAEELAKVRALAKAATPGPWLREDRLVYTNENERDIFEAHVWMRLSGVAEDTAAYIAEMHPQRILKWADDFDDLNAKLATAIEALEFYANHYPGIEVRDGGDTARNALAKLKEKP